MRTNERADESLNRAGWTVHRSDLATLRVCYAVTSAESGMLCGVADVVRLFEQQCAGPVTLKGKSDGESFAAGEVVMTIEGPFQELVALETEYLGLLSLSAGAANMARLVEAMGDSPIIDASAACYPPELIGRLATAAAVGGAQGTTTRAGHAEAHAHFGIGNEQVRVGQQDARSFYLYAAVPDALTAVYGGNSIDSADACHDSYPQVPLTVPITFEGNEKELCSQSVGRFGSALAAVVLDMADNRVITGGHETRDRAFEMRMLSQATDRQAAIQALDRYGFGPGVTIEAVNIIRDLLDSIGGQEVSILVAGDFSVEKVKAFHAVETPLDGIATGSWVKFSPFVSDIIRVFTEERWQRRCKAGRNEIIEEQDLPTLLVKA